MNWRVCKWGTLQNIGIGTSEGIWALEHRFDYRMKWGTAFAVKFISGMLKIRYSEVYPKDRMVYDGLLMLPTKLRTDIS